MGGDGWRWEDAKEEALVRDSSEVWSRKMWANTNATAKLHTFSRLKSEMRPEAYRSMYKGHKRRTLAAFWMGVAPINGEKARWSAGAGANPEDECPFCPGQKESELHIFTCPEYLHLCDCGSCKRHMSHGELDIIALINEMKPETCYYIHNALNTRRQRLVELWQ